MPNEKTRICYAVMPYGGEDQEKIDRFNMVYQLFMQIPASAKGFEIRREDYNPQGGMITRSIIKHLAEDDLVIADLSNNNWNVAYELGIRHALIKGRTILICDGDTDLKFDIRGFNVIRYDGNNPANNMFDVQRRVIEAIDDRIQSTSKADNIVHEVFNFPFERMIDSLTLEDTEQELAKLKNENAALSDENASLKGKLGEFARDSDRRTTEQQDGIAQKIESALGSIEYSGDKVVLKIRQLTQLSEEAEPDYKEIQRVLERAFTEGYLTESNFRDIYFIFKGLGIFQLTVLTLEIAAERYPESLDFKSYLANEYSENSRTRDKAIQYADEVLQISEINGRRVTKCEKIDDDQLASCLQAYINMRRFDVMVEIIPKLLSKLPMHRQRLMINLAVAYRELGNNEEQEKTLSKLVEEFPRNDTNHFVLNQYFHIKDDYKQAYYHLLLAAALDINDAKYPQAIAGLIMDEHIYVDKNNQVVSLMGKDKCAKVAVPFLMFAVKNQPTPQCLEKCLGFILKNGLVEYYDVFKKWVENGMERNGIPDLNYEGVEYLTKVVENLSDDICSKMYLEDGLGTFS